MKSQLTDHCTFGVGPLKLKTNLLPLSPRLLRVLHGHKSQYARPGGYMERRSVVAYGTRIKPPRSRRKRVQIDRLPKCSLLGAYPLSVMTRGTFDAHDRIYRSRRYLHVNRPSRPALKRVYEDFQPED